jgi:CBS domain containing-hemolysin-like protein
MIIMLFFEGKTPLKDFYRVMGISDVEADLFWGRKVNQNLLQVFLLEQIGLFPRKLQKKFHNYTFIVEVMDKKRIKQVKCTRES